MRAMGNEESRMKGDESILGQGDFVETVLKAAQENFDKPIVTTIREAEEFYKAKEDHQDYYARNKDKNRYCPAVITPKLKKLGLDY